MNVIRIKFEAYAPNYDFFTDEEANIGDFFIVPSARDYGFTVVKVMEVNPNVHKATKWAVCKLDTTKYNERLASEAKREELLKKMNNKLRKFSEERLVAMLISIDPEAAAIQAELDDLDGLV